MAGPDQGAAAPPPPGAGAGRGRLALLALLALVLGALLWYRLDPAAEPPGPASNQRTAAGQGKAAAAKVAELDVQLGALERERPQPPASGRNPFGFQAAPAQAPPPANRTPDARPPPARSGPAAAPQIGLKFIGIVEAPATALKVAVLSDGRFVFHGREGDIIEGRYRIVRIGVESIVLEHVDGGGRQTIRLTG